MEKPDQGMPDLFAEFHPAKADRRAQIVLPELSDDDEGSDELDLEQVNAVELASAKAKEVDKELDLRAASEGKGNPRQMFNLGTHLAKAGNMTGAVMWFRRSARSGYAKAEYNLGACLVRVFREFRAKVSGSVIQGVEAQK
jgi:TPR repeat protein